MRIVIDLQGAQTESRYRGIGRYTMSFAKGVVRNCGKHEVILALNGLFPDTIEPIRAAFNGMLPRENIRVWHAPGPIRQNSSGNEKRCRIAEVMREAFIASLQPDIVHICSFFEGYVDDAATSIFRFDSATPVSVTLYDLIPVINSQEYLEPDPGYARFYRRRIDELQHASTLLAISDSAAKEGIQYLPYSNGDIFNVSTAVDGKFQPLAIEDTVRTAVLSKFGITKAFILHTGGADERKNLGRLIQAYASLSPDMRSSFQLVLAGRMPDNNMKQLQKIAASAGLEREQLMITGYLSDEELVLLYNLCDLFVFPSWHEGFGLPALEAMACGAPVIGANTSSLPELIGCQAALFDPYDAAAISEKMALVLEDNEFRKNLCEHGLEQAKRFSWDRTASLAIETWERTPLRKPADYLQATKSQRRLIDNIAGELTSSDEKLQRLVALHLSINQLSGIERQLFLDVSEICQRDSATGVQRVVRSYLLHLLCNPPDGFRVEPVFATQEKGYQYARSYTRRILRVEEDSLLDGPIRWQRGDIFFGLDMQHHVQIAHSSFYSRLREEGVTVKFLVHDLLPIQLEDYFNDPQARALHENWLAMISMVDGAVCVTKATCDAFDSWVTETGIIRAPGFQCSWVHNGADIKNSTPSTGLPSNASHILTAIKKKVSFLCVATIEPRKCQLQILEAMQQLWDLGNDINIIFVGREGWKSDEVVNAIACHRELDHRLFWLKGISDEYLEQVYCSCTCLIAASINEGFGLPIVEAAQYDLPVIARDITVFREVAGEGAFYFTGYESDDLAEALIEWLSLYRKGEHPKSSRVDWSTWEESAEALKKAVVEDHYPRRQLLLDVSELARHDAGTGIQRVVRSLLREICLHPPSSYRVEPVYASGNGGYKYARHFCREFFGEWQQIGDTVDHPIDYAPGDIFLGLDFQPEVQSAECDYLHTLRRQGAEVKFIIYDLLSVQMPEYFLPGNDRGFGNWLRVVTEMDGAICISRSVADDLQKWLFTNKTDRSKAFEIDWFHLGSEFAEPTTEEPPPTSITTTIQRLQDRPSFLIVGTIEPRKGHAQVLEAFDELWKTDLNVNLVIVGRAGWMVDYLVEAIRSHPEFGSRLFWLEGVDDKFLAAIYKACTCLIAASSGEGFGLPLIEAAQMGLPIIARNLPVFREVTGNHAYFFDSKTGHELATTIESWLRLYEEGCNPVSDEIERLSWRDSADLLLSRVIP